MKALILGSGGREQALAWKVASSPLITEVYLAPGNGQAQPKCRNVALPTHASIATFVQEQGVELLIVGPEAPLVEGLVDYLRSQPQLSHLHIVGPTRQGAELEGSKDFAKAFMARHHIPTAKYRTFTPATVQEGKAFLATEVQAPYVLKADGLAAGKGVLIMDQLAEAQQELEAMLGGKFGSASNSVVVEEYLSGVECSVFVLTDGKSYQLLPTAKDYKRVGEGDSGLNTGGMGAVSPVPFADATFMQKVEERIIAPTVRGLAEEGIDYRGFIFFGLMNCQGNPYVIEYNCRMGDPETEAVMLRVADDLVPSFLALREQQLSALPPLTEAEEAVVTVVATSGGYPEAFEKGFAISGLDAPLGPRVQLFQAGTKRNTEGQVLTNGGRVLALSSRATTLAEARHNAYTALAGIEYQGIYYRKDIGEDMLNWQP